MTDKSGIYKPRGITADQVQSWADEAERDLGIWKALRECAANADMHQRALELLDDCIESSTEDVKRLKGAAAYRREREAEAEAKAKESQD